MVVVPCVMVMEAVTAPVPVVVSNMAMIWPQTTVVQFVVPLMGHCCNGTPISMPPAGSEVQGAWGVIHGQLGGGPADGGGTTKATGPANTAAAAYGVTPITQ